MSHFTTVQTRIHDVVCLADVLKELGFSVTQAEQGQKLQVRGYEGQKAEADMVVHASKSYDIGVIVGPKGIANGVVEVTVADTGSGLDELTLQQLFSPFFTTKPQGLGLGLSLSRSIIEAHGGRLWAENLPQGGAQFRFTLPIAKEQVHD